MTLPPRRRRPPDPLLGQQELAGIHGVTRSTISLIRRGKLWTHITRNIKLLTAAGDLPGRPPPAYHVYMEKNETAAGATHHFHIEFADGAPVGFDVTPDRAPGIWDELCDEGYRGRTRITHARWTRPGRTKAITAGVFGTPASERPAPATAEQQAEARRAASQAETAATAAANDRADRAEVRRSYYLRTGR